MKKRSVITAAALAGALSLVAGAASAEKVLKLGTVAFPGVPLGDSLDEALVKKLETVSGGKLKIDPYLVGNWLIGLYLLTDASVDVSGTRTAEEVYGNTPSQFIPGAE